MWLQGSLVAEYRECEEVWWQGSLTSLQARKLLLSQPVATHMP